MNALDTYLRLAGYHLTKPRRLIYEVLTRSEPLTMSELLQGCAGKINKASVYRTTALFEQLGIVQRLQIGWKYKLELSNAFQEHHHHATCLQCGTTIALPEDSLLEQRLQALATKLQFYPQDHQLEVRGLCRACHAQSQT